MDIKVWQVTKPFREIYQQTKQRVKTQLYEKFGVRVDQPRQVEQVLVFTTGNVCRRVFANFQLLSSALNIDEELIVRIRNILIAIDCQESINAGKIDTYCKATHGLYLKLYSWYKIPATVHKVLAHAGEIIIHLPAPLGVLAEEAAECLRTYLTLYGVTSSLT